MKLFISYCEKDREGLGYARKVKAVCKQYNIEAWIWVDNSSSAEWLDTEIAKVGCRQFTFTQYAQNVYLLAKFRLQYWCGDQNKNFDC